MQMSMSYGLTTKDCETKKQKLINKSIKKERMKNHV